MRDEQLHAVAARSPHFEVKKVKAPHVRSTFWSWDVEKVHAVVVRSTCPSQNAQSTPRSAHFWKFRGWKSGRRCGAKHISKSKAEENCRFRTTFGRSDVVLRGRRKGLWVSKTWSFVAVSTMTTTTTTTTIHYTALRYIIVHYTTVHYTTQHHNTTPHYATLHCTTPHYITLHYTTLHYTTLHSTTRTTPHHNYNSTTLQLQLYTTLHTAVVGEVTTATIATTPKNTTPTTFQSISGFALPSVNHNNQPLV